MSTERDPLCICNGSGLVPLPRGMSPGFYAFMAPGCIRRDDGTLLRLCSCRVKPPTDDEKEADHA